MDANYGQEYADLYRQHWWWRGAREAIIVEQIRSCHLPTNARILDFGCGDGLLLPVLARFGEVCGLEADARLISEREPFRDRIDVNYLADSPLRDESFDLITALDVLEHIEHDADILGELVGMLRPGGRLLITVPAFMLLWDRHDEINHHFRRYSKSSFSAIVPQHARISKSRYLFHALFGVKLLVGLINRTRKQLIAQHQLPPAWVNRSMVRALMCEYRWCGWMQIPWGTSLLVVLRKADSA